MFYYRLPSGMSCISFTLGRSIARRSVRLVYKYRLAHIYVMLFQYYSLTVRFSRQLLPSATVGGRQFPTHL